MKNYKPINTFTQRPSPAQIGSYILFLLQILVFSIIIQSRLSSSQSRIILICIYSISIGSQIIITFITSLSDPSDNFMITYRNDRSSIKNVDITNMLYCDICRSYVNLSSRHCRACVRCVENFDHHCMWINNCIGSKNYRIFIAMITLTCISMTVFIVSVALLWAEGGYEKFMAEMGVVWASSIIVLIFLILILNLIFLHIYLNYLGVTTYQFIMMNREKKQAQQEQQMTQQALQGKNKNKEQIKLQMPEVNKQKEVSKAKISKIDSANIKNNEISSQASMKNLAYNTSQIKVQKIFPDGIEIKKGNVFDDQHMSVADSVSERQSIRISQFFARNKSLAILVKSDVIVPHEAHENMPKTCKNTREINKSFKNMKK